MVLMDFDGISLDFDEKQMTGDWEKHQILDGILNEFDSISLSDRHRL